MKFFVFLGTFILLINLVCAAEIEISPLQEIYSKGTTFQAEINIGSFLYEDLTSDKINLFYNDTKIDIVPLLKKLNENKYFLYFKLPNDLAAGEYNLFIKDAVYDSNGVLVVNNIEKQFDISNDLNKTFYVEPAFIYIENLGEAYNTDLELLYSSGPLNEIEITSNNQYCYVSETKITLSSGEVKDFSVNIDNLIDVSEENYLSISDGNLNYKIPIYSGEANTVNNNVSSNGVIDVKFNLGINKYKDALLLNEKLTNKELRIKNFGDANSGKLSFDVVGNISSLITLNKNEISNLGANEESILKLDINAVEIGEFLGEIVVKNVDGTLDSLPVDITVVQSTQEKEKILQQEEENSQQTQTENKNNTFSYFIIGFFVVILVLVLIYLFYRRKTNLSS